MSYGRLNLELPPEPPKKALCAFFLYRQDIYEYIKQEHPNLRITEVTKIIGEMWKYLDPKLKERYEMEYEINRREVAKRRQAYEQQYGRQVKSRKSKKVKRAMRAIRNTIDKGFSYY